MNEKQTKSSPKDVPLAPLFHTILAAESKTSELFVKSFLYQGENISTKHLGQIFGFFEIPDTHEDNAYIVNFLASVVKKEYFINPKRSATDSFEAALHKINLALTELVKQGNTGWLGKLNGVVSVIENNRFHFSVTGDASILLYRENQVNLISEGLADKDAALHPLKTFLEISSGILFTNDKILITSPELFTLCPAETLRKNAFRMDKNGFARFVRAAVVNELPLGVSTIIDLEAAPKTTRPKKKATLLREESREKLQNVFSSVPFIESSPKQSAVKLEDADVSESEEELLPPSEYTDQKTGHIYVQGDEDIHEYQEPAAWRNFLDENLRPAVTSFALSIKRLTKKTQKNIIKNAAVIGMGSKEITKNVWQLSREKSQSLATKSSQTIQAKMDSHKAKKLLGKNTNESSNDFSFSAPEEGFTFIPEPIDEISISPLVDQELPNDVQSHSKRSSALESFSPQYQHEKKAAPTVSSLQSVIAIFQKYNQSLSEKQKFGIVVVLIAGIITAVLVTRNEQSTEITQSNTAEIQTIIESPSAETLPTLENGSELYSWNEGAGILTLTTDQGAIVVTPKSIVTNTKTLPFVATGTIETATYMPDLNMIFMWSSANELVSWSLVDQKFTANLFPLPVGVDVSKLGAYLTYLYALDANQGTIYRFARTEGGFSEPTSWLRTALPANSVQAFVVNDTIRITTTTTDQYLRGIKEKTLSEIGYQILGSSSAKNFTLGIETSRGELAVWNADGNLVHLSTYPDLVGVSTVTYSENTKKLLVTKDQKLLEYSLSW